MVGSVWTGGVSSTRACDRSPVCFLTQSGGISRRSSGGVIRVASSAPCLAARPSNQAIVASMSDRSGIAVGSASAAERNSDGTSSAGWRSASGRGISTCPAVIPPSPTSSCNQSGSSASPSRIGSPSGALSISITAASRSGVSTIRDSCSAPLPSDANEDSQSGACSLSSTCWTESWPNDCIQSGTSSAAGCSSVGVSKELSQSGEAACSSAASRGFSA